MRELRNIFENRINKVIEEGVLSPNKKLYDGLDDEEMVIYKKIDDKGFISKVTKMINDNLSSIKPNTKKGESLSPEDEMYAIKVSKPFNDKEVISIMNDKNADMTLFIGDFIEVLEDEPLEKQVAEYIINRLMYSRSEYKKMMDDKKMNWKESEWTIFPNVLD